MTKPTAFNDLNAAELYRSALEDFALPVDEKDKNKKTVLLAAFVEGGVSWNDYVAQHPEVAPEPEPAAEREPETVREGDIITSADVTTQAEPVEIVVKEEIPTTSKQKYLIKMVRENEVFEVRGIRFTRTHPYNLVSAAMADYLLTKEDGFRQATPSELQEFYG